MRSFNVLNGLDSFIPKGHCLLEGTAATGMVVTGVSRLLLLKKVALSLPLPKHRYDEHSIRVKVSAPEVSWLPEETVKPF